METAIIIILGLTNILGIFGWAAATKHRNERDRLENELAKNFYSDSKMKIEAFGNAGLQAQVDHIATVQMLILQEMKKEHQIQPAKDVLVTIGNLSDLKKSKGRSA